MKQLTILSFAILFSGTFLCQTPQTVTSTKTTTSVKETPIMYHRARIYYDGPKGILLLEQIKALLSIMVNIKFGVYIESDFFPKTKSRKQKCLE